MPKKVEQYDAERRIVLGHIFLIKKLNHNILDNIN